MNYQKILNNLRAEAFKDKYQTAKFDRILLKVKAKVIAKKEQSKKDTFKHWQYACE